ncbi:MAG: DctP family TRAP transporter solute-binding subunit [Syntrophomonadaceae bacterium]|nr:DctP family TRAP transporter solute-binding subunit [Syntrophomonadaceae bacterium]MDD3890539.1 DctP family TRAP transporter solute-binding subunit [Syntrophomonadaceae bacterium]MDD4550007.1 DctP family TRAP transporter solute-binding subunit [Syntrophomonadaceae bacterium]
MKVRRVLSILLSLMLFATLVTGCGGSKQPSDQSVDNPNSKGTYVFKFAHEEAPGSVQDLYAKQFAKVLEEKTDGRAKVEIFSIGQLGTDQDMLEALQSGAIDFAISSPGCTGTLLPEAQFVNLHFLFSDNMEVNKKVLNNSKAFYEDLANIYADKGIKVFSFWTEGFMDWTSNQPLTKTADFKGFKIRTMQSPLIISSYKAYGASPTPIPFSEVYSSLQLNMIDGQENPIFYVAHNNLHEVQKYITLSHHALYVAATVANPETYNSLPSDIQQAIVDTVEEVKDYSFDMQQDFNDKALEEMKSASGIQVLTISDQDREVFEKASIPLRDEYIKEVGDVGKKILDILVEDIEKAEKEVL